MNIFESRKRDELIYLWHQEGGLTSRQIARKFKVSIRTVYNAIRDMSIFYPHGFSIFK